jgi:hypothetical protein
MISSRRAIAVAIAAMTTIFSPATANAQDTNTAAPKAPPVATLPSPTTPVSTQNSPSTASSAAAAPGPVAVSAPVPPNTPNPAPAGQPAVHSEVVSADRVPGTGAPPTEAKPAIQDKVTMPKWLDNVTLAGGLILYYYQPLGLPSAENNNNLSIFFANLLLDGKWDIFGFHMEPRFRDTKLRPFFDGPVWLQEAYASIDLGKSAQLRIGKTYSHLGLFWDNSFYGNVQVYDGLKLDPDYGLSLEGALGKKDDPASLGYWVQYFVVDGSTNVSLEGRDTISIPGARRRNQAILRLEPRFRFGPASLALGGSAEFLQAADLPAPYGTENVGRFAGDAKLMIGSFGLWGEFTFQDGRTVSDFPVVGAAATATTPAGPGASSAHVDYALAGAEYTLGPVTARYNVSTGYYTDVNIHEWMQVPAIGVAISPNLSILGEFVLWQSYSATGSSILDRSLNVTLSAHL